MRKFKELTILTTTTSSLNYQRRAEIAQLLRGRT